MKIFFCSWLFFSGVAASDVQWSEHSGYNCYPGQGAIARQSDDIPLSGLTVEDCEAACADDTACVGVTRETNTYTGNCWLRMTVETDKCEQGTQYTTYTNGRDIFAWIGAIEQQGGYTVLPAGVHYIDRQYVLPTGTHLEGAGIGQTIIQALYTGKDQQGEALCGEYHVNRIGIILGHNTYVGKFTFTGADYQRPYDNGDLCGGGAIETPGCAFPYCANPHSDTDERGPNINTGKGDGNGVGGVIVEDIEFTKNTVQNMLFMPQTEQGKMVSSDITIRNLKTEGTWADGLNIHGAHKNILVEGCSASNTGDDCFAAWDTAVSGEYLTNITFKNNYASNPHFNGNNRDCFSQFGGRSVNYIDNTCVNPTNAMIHFWVDFCGSGHAGSPGSDTCYPSDSVSQVSGNTLQQSSKPDILRDAGNLPQIVNPTPTPPPPTPTPPQDQPHIRSALTQRCVDVQGGDSQRGSAVWTWDCNGKQQQEWAFQDGQMVVQLGQDWCLDIPGGSFDNGNHLQIWDCNGLPQQKWSYHDNGGTGSIQTGYGKCMDLLGGEDYDGAPVAVWDCNGLPNQEWQVTFTSDLVV